jgi:UPF0716 family protein affecting phage T7 exclusion
LTGLILASAVVGVAALFLGGPGMFIPAAGVVFLCGLPFALISSFIHGEVSYSADRADRRAWEADDTEYGIAVMREEGEDSRWYMREEAEDRREAAREESAAERDLARKAWADERAAKRGSKVIVDNRQIHFHRS